MSGSVKSEEASTSEDYRLEKLDKANNSQAAGEFASSIAVDNVWMIAIAPPYSCVVWMPFSARLATGRQDGAVG